MRIGILGSGLMGRALGQVWAQKGHNIRFSYTRNMRGLSDFASSLGMEAQAVQPKEAADSDVLLIAVNWTQLDDVLAQAGSIEGKILLSCMLPMNADNSALALGLNTSGAEELAKRTKAELVLTFNTIWSNAIPPQSSEKPSMFYVGDSLRAKASAVILIEDAGFEPFDAGSLQNARLVEPFGVLMGHIGFEYNPNIVYKLLNR
jgi:predicted dinucleotide-binding enzyme